VVSDIEKLLQRTIGRDIELVTHLEPELPNIVVDPSQIEQILLNLAVNSRDAMPLGGKLIIRTAKASFDEDYIERHPYVTVGIYVELEVSDTGCGMSKDVRSRVFEPFFTTKERGKGTGLGMAVVHGCVKQLGGSIEIYSEPELGTTIRIYIPSTEESSADPVPRPKKILMRGRGETVLVVEDEEALLKLAVRVLARNGYVVHQALDGSDALRIIEQHEGPIHLLLTDVVMPGLSGKDLARSVREALPNIKVLYVSGYAGEVIEQHGLVERSERLLQKPFSEADLLSAVGEILQMEGLT